MKRGYGYIRVSTNYQRDDGYSLEFQEKEIKRYAEYNKFILINIFKDEGKSGRKIEGRDQLQQVLEILEEGDTLILYSLSRLVRKARDFYNIEDNLRQRGCELVSIKEGIETFKPLGKAMAGLATIFAELESDNTSQRVSAGMQMKKEKGERLGRIPYGWKLSNGKGSDLIEDEEKQKVIKKIKEMKADREKVKDIIKYLVDNQIPPPKASKQWTESTIANILKKKEINTKGRTAKE